MDVREIEFHENVFTDNNSRTGETFLTPVVYQRHPNKRPASKRILAQENSMRRGARLRFVSADGRPGYDPKSVTKIHVA